MFRTIFGVLMSTLLLLHGAIATPNRVCSTGIYKTLVPLLANDPTVQRFRAALPPSNKLDRSRCPKQLQLLSYSVIQTFCGCVKNYCGSPKMSCPAGCFNTNTDNSHCGSCDTVCGDDQSCQSGVCKCNDTTEEIDPASGQCIYMGGCSDEHPCPNGQTCLDGELCVK